MTSLSSRFRSSVRANRFDIARELEQHVKAVNRLYADIGEPDIPDLFWQELAGIEPLIEERIQKLDLVRLRVLLSVVREAVGKLQTGSVPAEAARTELNGQRTDSERNPATEGTGTAD